MTIQIRAQRPQFYDGIGIYIFETDGTRITATSIPILLKKLGPDEEAPLLEPVVTIHGIDIQAGNTAQVLMDDLWQCGIRPSEGTGSAGSLKATQNHLEDMRKIVFAKLNIL